MASIEKIKTKKGTAYRVRYSINGKPQKQYFPAGTSQTVIKTFINEIEGKKLKDKLNGNAAGINLVKQRSFSLSQLKDMYIKSRQHEIQIERHVHTLNILINFFGPSVPINEIDHHKINEWKNHLYEYKLKRYNAPTWEQDQRSRRGTNKEYSNARTIFTWSFENDIITVNPFAKTKTLAAAEPMIHLPTRDDERKFYKQLESWQAKLSYWIMRLAGLRRSEVRNLKHKHLDTNKEIIIIEKQKNQKPIILPMLPALVKIVKGFDLQGDPDDYIFDYCKDYCTFTFRRALDRAGLHHIKNPAHIFRHAFTTTLLIQSDNLALTREMARHSDFNTTKKYLHLLPEDKREKIKNLRMGKSKKTE